MATVTKTRNQTGNTGALAADTLFYVSEGTVEFSTDAGTTYIPFGVGEKIIFSAALTVHWRGGGTGQFTFSHMAV